MIYLSLPSSTVTSAWLGLTSLMFRITIWLETNNEHISITDTFLLLSTKLYDSHVYAMKTSQ